MRSKFALSVLLRRNYFRKLSPKIMIENYQLVYQSRRKWEIYRDIGVTINIGSKKYAQ